jgi:hypothetical protein
MIYGYCASYRLIAPSEMGTWFLVVWFHCNLIVKIGGRNGIGHVLKELVSVLDLRN